jgi:hypothetical protein
VTARPDASSDSALGGNLIRGELLAGSPAADYQVGNDGSGAAAKQATGGGGTDIVGTTRSRASVAVGIALVVALFGLGALSERRPRSHRGAPDHPRANRDSLT